MKERQRSGGGCTSVIMGFMIGAGLVAAGAYFIFNYNEGLAVIGAIVGGALGATVSWVSVHGHGEIREQDPYDMDRWD